MVTQNEQRTSHLVKCVLQKPEFLELGGKQYRSGVKIRQLKILVGELSQQAVLEMLQAMGMGAWDVVDWWPSFELEPQF